METSKDRRRREDSGSQTKAKGTRNAFLAQGPSIITFNTTHEIEAEGVYARQRRNPQRVFHGPRFAFEKTNVEMGLRVLCVLKVDDVRVVGEELEVPRRRLTTSYSGL